MLQGFSLLFTRGIISSTLSRWVFVLIGVVRGMAENAEPYNCARCGWSGLEPIRGSGERIDSFERFSSDTESYARESFGEPSFVNWSECPDCKATVYTESQLERQKWEGIFAIGMLVFIGFILFMM